MEKSPKIDNSYLAVLNLNNVQSLCAAPFHGTGPFSPHMGGETEVQKGGLLTVT